MAAVADLVDAHVRTIRDICEGFPVGTVLSRMGTLVSERVPRRKAASELRIDDEIDYPSTIDPSIANTKSSPKRSDLPDHVVVVHEQLIRIERRAEWIRAEQPVEVPRLALARIVGKFALEKREQVRAEPRLIRHDVHSRPMLKGTRVLRIGRLWSP